jgi:hypothetical protein
MPTPRTTTEKSKRAFFENDMGPLKDFINPYLDKKCPLMGKSQQLTRRS